MAKFKLTFTLVIIGLFLIIAIQNTEVVSLSVFVWEFQMSRIILLTVPLLLGFALGFLVAKISSAAKNLKK